jgi:hypothetical protein
MNVDTGEFAALTGRVETLEAAVARLTGRLADMIRAEEIIRRAGMPDPVLEAAERRTARAARHLRPVK